MHYLAVVIPQRPPDEGFSGAPGRTMVCADSSPGPQDAEGQHDPESTLANPYVGFGASCSAWLIPLQRQVPALVTDEAGNGSGGQLEFGHDLCDRVMPVDVDGDFGRTMAGPVGDLAQR